MNKNTNKTQIVLRNLFARIENEQHRAALLELATAKVETKKIGEDSLTLEQVVTIYTELAKVTPLVTKQLPRIGAKLGRALEEARSFASYKKLLQTWVQNNVVKHPDQWIILLPIGLGVSDSTAVVDSTAGAVTLPRTACPRCVELEKEILVLQTRCDTLNEFVHAPTVFSAASSPSLVEIKPKESGKKKKPEDENAPSEDSNPPPEINTNKASAKPSGKPPAKPSGKTPAKPSGKPSLGRRRIEQ